VRMTLLLVRLRSSSTLFSTSNVIFRYSIN
jgi:hypothetical protein